MCIIAIKPKGKEMFDHDMIRTMFDNNNDGAGFVYPVDGKLEIHKGYMKVSKLLKALDARELLHVPVILHFRIGTHGANSPGNTHPFPVTSVIKELKKTQCTTDLAMVHNGIISSIDPRKGISDTMEFIATVVAPLRALSPSFYLREEGKLMLDTLSGSKLAFMDTAGKVSTVGDFVEHDGYLFSNGTYKQSVYVGKGYSSTHTYNYNDALDMYETFPGRAARKDVWLMPLPENAIVIDDALTEWSGQSMAIDPWGQVHEIDHDEAYIFGGRAFTDMYDDVVYDYKKAKKFKIWK